MSALRLVLLSSLLFVSACTLNTETGSPPPPEIETVIVVVTATSQPEATPAPTETESPPPVCQVTDGSPVCELPEAEVRDKFCIKKVPYILMVFPRGTSFEVVDEGFTCTDEGIRGGEQMVSCYGPELYSFDLNVCNAACVPTGAVLEQGACEAGFGYDSTNDCCLRLPTTDSNCRIIRIDLGACSGT